MATAADQQHSFTSSSADIVRLTNARIIIIIIITQQTSSQTITLYALLHAMCTTTRYMHYYTLCALLHVVRCLQLSCHGTATDNEQSVKVVHKVDDTG